MEFLKLMERLPRTARELSASRFRILKILFVSLLIKRLLIQSALIINGTSPIFLKVKSVITPLALIKTSSLSLTTALKLELQVWV